MSKGQSGFRGGPESKPGFSIASSIAARGFQTVLIAIVLVLSSAVVMAQQYTMQEVTDYKAAMNQQDPQARKAALEKFLTDHPASVLKNNIRIFLAETFEKLGDAEAQVQTLETVIKEDPKFMEAYNRLAQALLKKNEIERAEQLARQATDMIEKMAVDGPEMKGASPEQIVAFKREMTATYKNTLAQALIKGNKQAEAKTILSDILANPPQQPESVIALAESFKALGEIDNALKVLDEGALKETAENEGIRKLHKAYYIEKVGSETGYQEHLDKARETVSQQQRAALIGSLTNTEGPEFAFSALDNTAIGSRQLANKIVILNFWATWCKPCHMELPHFQKAYEKFQKDEKVSFLAVSTDSGATRASVPTFVSERKFTFPVAYSSEDSKKFGFQGIPSLFVLDGKGRIRFQRSGFNPNTDLVDELTWIIEELKKE